MSGIKDVAELAGVSISTVSNVLNGTRYVSTQLEEKVRKAAKELSYQANPIARGMKMQNTGTIGVIVEALGGGYYPYVIKGIDSYAARMDYQIIVCDAGIYSGDFARTREEKLFHRLISNRVDGILFVSAVDESEARDYFLHIRKVANTYKPTPIVSLERDLSSYGIDSVYYDCFENARMATQHLINCGCKNIACITGPRNLQIVKDRTAGFRACMKKNQMQLNEQIQIVHGNYTHQSGFIQTKRLLDNFPYIDGIFAENDQMAVGALKCLQEYGKKIPEEVKVIGYDDVFFASMMEPALSSIHVQKRHAGISAARILFERIKNREAAPEPQDVKSIKMESRLVVRKSTVAQAPEDWIFTDW